MAAGAFAGAHLHRWPGHEGLVAEGGAAEGGAAEGDGSLQEGVVWGDVGGGEA